MGHDARAVAAYMLRRSREQGVYLTSMHILKLVYIAHGWMLGIYHRPLIRDQIEAWQYGPVIPNLYHMVKRFGSGPIDDSFFWPPEEFDVEETDLMDRVIDAYNGLQSFQLSGITHQPGSPWSEVYTVGSYSAPITDSVIEAHYTSIAKERGASA